MVSLALRSNGGNELTARSENARNAPALGESAGALSVGRAGQSPLAAWASAAVTVAMMPVPASTAAMRLKLLMIYLPSGGQLAGHSTAFTRGCTVGG